jgi:hypothetical protein
MCRRIAKFQKMLDNPRNVGFYRALLALTQVLHLLGNVGPVHLLKTPLADRADLFSDPSIVVALVELGRLCPNRGYL